MVIRHAEKPAKSNGAAGVREDGKHDPESLTVRGWQRAGALAVLFSSDEHTARLGLAVPDAVYASASTIRGSSERPEQTIDPLVARLRGYRPEFDPVLTHEKGSERDMVDDVMRRDGAVLICWQHELIPEIGNAIVGNKWICPQEWPGDRFDLVWSFERADGGKWQFRQVPQLLLAGDRAHAIPLNE